MTCSFRNSCDVFILQLATWKPYENTGPSTLVHGKSFDYSFVCWLLFLKRNNIFVQGNSFNYSFVDWELFLMQKYMYFCPWTFFGKIYSLLQCHGICLALDHKNLSFSHSHGDDKVWISPKLRKLLKGGNPPNVGLSSQIWDQPSISFYLTSKLNVWTQNMKLRFWRNC